MFFGNKMTNDDHEVLLLSKYPLENLNYQARPDLTITHHRNNPLMMYLPLMIQLMART